MVKDSGNLYNLSISPNAYANNLSSITNNSRQGNMTEILKNMIETMGSEYKYAVQPFSVLFKNLFKNIFLGTWLQ